jgi:hypothetical protein
MTDVQFKPGDDVQLRNGWEAKVLDVVEGQEWCVFMRYMDEDGYCDCLQVRADGRMVSFEESPLDLIHKPKRMSGFVNVYDDGGSVTFWEDRHSADWSSSHSDRNRIACIDLSQFEEGEGL